MKLFLLPLLMLAITACNLDPDTATSASMVPEFAELPTTQRSLSFEDADAVQYQRHLYCPAVVSFSSGEEIAGGKYETSVLGKTVTFDVTQEGNSLVFEGRADSDVYIWIEVDLADMTFDYRQCLVAELKQVVDGTTHTSTYKTVTFADDVQITDNGIYGDFSSLLFLGSNGFALYQGESYSEVPKFHAGALCKLEPFTSIDLTTPQSLENLIGISKKYDAETISDVGEPAASQYHPYMLVYYSNGAYGWYETPGNNEADTEYEGVMAKIKELLTENWTLKKWHEGDQPSGGIAGAK